MLSEPKLELRAERPYAAVHERLAPRELARRPVGLWGEVESWLRAHGAAIAGPPFLRFLVIDMSRCLEIEAGFPIDRALEPDARVASGVVPAGRYASIVHEGPFSDLIPAHAALQRWGEARGVRWLSWATDHGTAWGGRLESYLGAPHRPLDSARQRTEIAYLALDDPR